MRRFDKKKNIEKVNKLLERRILKESHGEMRTSGKFFNHILQGEDATKENAYLHARGLDWGEIETHEESFPYLTYIDSINGVGIYYNYGHDGYYFMDETIEPIQEEDRDYDDVFGRLGDILDPNQPEIPDEEEVPLEEDNQDPWAAFKPGFKGNQENSGLINLINISINWDGPNRVSRTFLFSDDTSVDVEIGSNEVLDMDGMGTVTDDKIRKIEVEIGERLNY